MNTKTTDKAMHIAEAIERQAHQAALSKAAAAHHATPAPARDVRIAEAERRKEEADKNPDKHKPLEWKPGLSPDEAIALAQQATNTMLKSEPPAPVVMKLKAYAAADKHADFQTMGEMLIQYEEEHAAAAKDTNDKRRAAADMSDCDMDEAAELTAEAERHASRRDSARAAADDVRRRIVEHTATDYADIVAAAVTMYYLLDKAWKEGKSMKPTAAKLARDYGITPDEWTNKRTEDGEPLAPELIDEIRRKANYSRMIKAARDYHRKQAHGDLLDTYHTDKTPAAKWYAKVYADWTKRHPNATDKERAERKPLNERDAERKAYAYWTSLYGVMYAAEDSPNGFTVLMPQNLKGGNWNELKFCEATKTKPSGWYFIAHRRTMKAAKSLDEIAEQAGDTTAAETLHADEQERRADIADYVSLIVADANLNERQRRYIAAYCSEHAAKAAHEAMNEYAEGVKKWNAERVAAWQNIGEKVRRNAAAGAIGLEAFTPAESNAHKRIIEALKRVHHAVKREGVGREAVKHEGVKREGVYTLSTDEAAQIAAAFTNRRAVRTAADPCRPDALYWLNLGAAAAPDKRTAEELAAMLNAAKERHAATLQAAILNLHTQHAAAMERHAAELAAQYQSRPELNATPEALEAAAVGIARYADKKAEAAAEAAAKAAQVEAAAEKLKVNRVVSDREYEHLNGERLHAYIAWMNLHPNAEREAAAAKRAERAAKRAAEQLKREMVERLRRPLTPEEIAECEARAAAI